MTIQPAAVTYLKRRDESWRKNVVRLLTFVAPPAAFLVVFFLVPLSLIAVVSLLQEFPGASPRFTLSNYGALARSFYADYVITTILFGLEVTSLTLLVGYPFAYYLVRRRGFEYQLLLLSIIAPLLVGVVPRTVGWTILLGYEGVLNAFLVQTGISRQPLQLMYNPGAAVVGMVHVLLPFMVLALASTLATINTTLHEAAQSLGASTWQVFWRVTLPLSMRGVAVGCALVFSLAVGAYVTPVVLGGGKMRLLAPLAYDQFMSIVNWPFGSAVSVALLVLGLFFVIGLPAAMQRRGQGS